MPPKSILKKKKAPGRTATGKRARPGQNIRNAAKAEAESLKAKSKKGGRPPTTPGVEGGRHGQPSRPGSGQSKFSVNASVVKPKGKPDPRASSGKKEDKANVKGKKRVQIDQDMSDDGDEDDNDFGDAEDDEGPATDEEIERLQDTKSSSSGTKRKRPTTASEFGTTLTSLLGDQPQPTSSTSSRKSASQAQPILSLSRNRLPPSRSALALERKAEEAVKKAKSERVERARVKDVMEGWQQPGGSQEFERGLRKVAQRGVIKLFNAILSASKAAEEGLTMAEQAGWKDEKTKRKEKDNVLGRGGKEALTKEGFLDMVRQG